MVKSVRTLLTLALLSFVVASCADDRTGPMPGADLTAPPMSGPSPSLMAAVDEADYTGRQLIVFERMRIDSRTVRKIQRFGGEVVAEYPQIGMLVATGLDANALAKIRAGSAVKAAGMDVNVQWIGHGESFANTRQMDASGFAPQAGADQSDALAFDLFGWPMRHIRADEAWTTTRAGENILVCVLDTGIDPGQVDIAGKVDVMASYIPWEPFIEDLNGHGTLVAGLVSSNGIVTASVAPKARLCAIKVLDASGFGPFEGIIQGILHAHSVGAEVANLSLGIYVTESFLKDPLLHDLVEALTRTILYVRSQGVLVVAAAGNDGANLDADRWDWLHIPSQIPGAVSVGATGPSFQTGFDMLAPYSNYGVSGVDVAAGGGNFVGDLRDLVWGPCSRYVCGADFFILGGTGTSLASPLAAGTAAVVDGQRRGRWSPNRVQYCLEKGARNPSGGWFSAAYGSGIVDVVEAVRC